MKITGMLWKVAKPFVDVKTWIGYAQLKEMSNGVGETVKRLFIPQKAEHEETFEAAMQRFNLTEEALKQRIQAFTLLSIFWLLLALGLCVYGAHLIGQRSFHGFFACVGLALICFAQSFYYHFWRFQMKQRRLGCTIQEWFNSNFRGGT